MADIILKDLYGAQQTYRDVGELALPTADGGTGWYIERPVEHFVLRGTDYEPSGQTAIATGGVGPMFGGGELNLLMVAYAPVEGVSQHPVIALVSAVDGVQTGYYYVYEPLTGAEILAVMNDTAGTCAGTAQPGWNIVENADGADTLRHIDDPESVSIVVPHPYTVLDEAAFYSFLSPAGQENKAVTLTGNGTVEITPTPGSRGLRSVQVTVDVAVSGDASGGVESDILPLTTYSDFVMNDTYGVYGVDTEVPYTLTVGETYFVVWDGVTYECVAQDSSALTAGGVVLGNCAAWGLAGNGEPFAIATVNQGAALTGSLTDTEAGGSHTVRIYQTGQSTGAKWKSWQMINGQCTVTEEEFEQYFSSYAAAAVYALFDTSPLGVAQTIKVFRATYAGTTTPDKRAIMCFADINFSVQGAGALDTFEPTDYVNVYIAPDETGGYRMQILYAYMNSTDVTQYVTASAVPQTIYAIPSPFGG